MPFYHIRAKERAKYATLLHCRTGQKYGLKRSEKMAAQNELNFALFTCKARKFNMSSLVTFFHFKVQLTPNFYFCLNKLPCLPDLAFEKIITVAFFVNFLWIFKIRKNSFFVCHDRGQKENGSSSFVTSRWEPSVFLRKRKSEINLELWEIIVLKCLSDVK